MKIALINGSPKVNNSASGALLTDLTGYFSKETEIIECSIHKPALSENKIKELLEAEVWVFAYPLYVDGIPGHLLSCLVQLEEICLHHPKIHVYGIVNCGFYEGIQAEFALKLLQNWCIKTGFVWGGGIGVGGGGGLAMMPKMEPGQGPKAPIDKSLNALAEKILQCQTQENCYVSVAFPRFLYQMGAQIGWRQMIKKNGGKKRDLNKKP